MSDAESRAEQNKERYLLSEESDKRHQARIAELESELEKEIEEKNELNRSQQKQISSIDKQRAKFTDDNKILKEKLQKLEWELEDKTKEYILSYNTLLDKFKNE